ncbi:hypothetical protein Moror_8611 [Moniliophthora roreri MCA 2997]|uniref:Aminoglycoside phosphotransferase domain-containing protein n=1 Tax=Moniliophthora roreri (strain MCA 2997) TaxID=1381753 RepID=V2XB06_MONRO|nr:hypothetical protein Moror_8611 [Moniliophthora roreri MCA 2997]
MLGRIADMADDLVGWVVADARPDTDYKGSVIDEWSDKQIIGRGNETGHENNLLKITDTTYLLASHTILKAEPIYPDEPASTEAAALALVFKKTTIPVPRLRRTIHVDSPTCIIAMDFVEGKVLSEAWPNLTIMEKIRVACALRRYIRQLRRKLQGTKDTPPGPATTILKACEAPSFFGSRIDTRGPFKTAKDLSSFLSRVYDHAMKIQKVPPEHPWHKERQISTEPLVFCHMDLVPRNIILGNDGRVWVIDWGFSGYYPAWFEYVAMVEQAANDRERDCDFQYWEKLIPFICGPYFSEHKWYWRMVCGFDYKLKSYYDG